MARKKPVEIDWSKYDLRPAGSYLDSLINDLGGMDDLLKSMEEADTAAKELLRETANTDALKADAPKTKAEEAPETPNLEELLAELDSLIGLEQIKKNVRSLMNLVKVRKLREEAGLKVPPISLHLVFMGNPGTGKTTVARLVSKLYHAIGVLSKGQLVEVDRSGLVAGFVGQTAIKTQGIIEKAMGGVLFIDEAYSLAPENGSQNDFGHEAVETILKAMEDHRDDLVVIVAGYDEPMERFISSNPGLESRFNRYLVFPDYNAEELLAMFNMQCEKNGYKTDEAAAEYAAEFFRDMYEQRDENFGNGRNVRNVFENAVAAQADRLAALQDTPDKEALMTITREDVEKAAVMGG